MMYHEVFGLYNFSHRCVCLLLLLHLINEENSKQFTSELFRFCTLYFHFTQSLSLSLALGWEYYVKMKMKSNFSLTSTIFISKQFFRRIYQLLTLPMVFFNANTIHKQCVLLKCSALTEYLIRWADLLKAFDSAN